MAAEHVRVASEGGVLSITLDRPDKLNALSAAMHAALAAAFDRLAADPTLQLCVVRSASERAFCVGSDVSAISPGDALPFGASGYGGLAERFDLDKPVIAVVDGLCLGGGFELALACDLIVASPRARFSLPEPRLGMIAMAGGIHRLIRAAGIKQAMLPLLTGEPVSGEDGFRMGFVSKLVDPEDLDAAARTICARILANSPVAVRTTKALAEWSLGQPDLAAAMAAQEEHPAYRRWMASADGWEGIRAFVEKRPPVWRGH